MEDAREDEQLNCGIAASSQDIRTMVEAVYVLDRQAGGIQMGVVRQEMEELKVL